MKVKNGMLLTAVLWMIALILLPEGCFAAANRYQSVFMDLFDTVTSVTGYAQSEDEYQQEVGKFYEGMKRYHQLYDIYHEYEGMVNLCTLNRRAGETVPVDREIIDLLVFAREVSGFSGGRTDASLGSVLNLWHEARENGIENPVNACLPEESALAEAAVHTGFDKIEIDEETGTVRFTDTLLRLDVGALAKGYAVQRVCENIKSGYLFSVGGNVFATGPKADGSAWTCTRRKAPGVAVCD